MNQEDDFRIKLTAEEQHLFDLRGASSGGGTLVDPVLILVDASSNILKTDDNGGTATDCGGSGGRT